MRIIDIHNHPDWHGHDFRRFVANMDENGIERTWLLSWETPPDERDPLSVHVVPSGGHAGPIPFERCCAYVQRAPDRFVLGYGPDPRDPGALLALRAARDIHNVRVCGELKLRMMADNPDALELYRLCGELGMPVTVHLDYPIDKGRQWPRRTYWYGGSLDAFERAVAACPETTFLGHAPGFWAHISGDDQFDKTSYPKTEVVPGGRLQDLLRTYPNLHCDLSAGSGLNALRRDPEHAKRFVEEFQDRILFGRDSFSNGHQAFLDGLGLPEDVLRKVYAENALRLVPLED